MVKKTNFKGLEVSELSFNRKKEKCSKIVANSCGTRDCTLEVYKLGDDLILSGGLCPKGNTSSFKKKAPDYFRMYLNILDSHLSKLVKPFEDSKAGNRILIPRSLTFLNEKGILYASIYKNLGFDVVLSPESDDEISNLGKAYSHSEFCYPLILAHGHAAYLKNKMQDGDKILLVDAISETKEKYKLCPYVASSGNVIMGNLELLEKDILLPIIYFKDSDYPIYKSIFKDLTRVFGNKFSEKQVKEAVNRANEDQKIFSDEVHKKGEEILRGLNEINQKAFIAIGRGYTIFDPRACSKVHELFINNSLHFIPSYFIKSDIDVDKIVDNMFWYQGRNMIEKTYFTFNEKNLFPVRLTNFNCGPDSIIHFHEEKLANEFNKPWLVLETDGHNSNAQFGTRILAHNRVIDKYLENPSVSKPEALEKSDEYFSNRIIGLPYMSDSSEVIASALKSIGLKTEVIPTRTKEGIELAKKIVNTNTCQPFSFQVGDQIAWIESYKRKGIDPNKNLAIFFPKARGPCRFGQYNNVLKNIFKELGYPGVLMISPSSNRDYGDVNLPKNKIILVSQLSFKGVIANELLKSCLLRTRPYEIKKGEGDMIYLKSHNELMKLIEKKASIKQINEFLKIKLKEFENIERDDRVRYPLVLMNGEIFVRSHEESNQHSIKLLEEHKLEVILEPIFTWINYVNKNRLKKTFEEGHFIQMGISLLKRAYIDNVEKSFSKIFDKYLKGRESHDPFHLINKVEKAMIYNSAIEGESCVSIGGAYAFIKDELSIDGIFHTGPLGCMHETIATSRIQALINKERSKDRHKLIPFMDAVFGDSPTANLDSQVAIFAENCWLRKEMREKLNTA